MKKYIIIVTSILIMYAISFAQEGSGIESKKAGDVIKVGGKDVVVKEIQNTPVVKNQYSKVFDFNSFGNPRLDMLRNAQGLAGAESAAKTEFDNQLLLMHWTYNRLKKFGSPDVDAKGAIEILRYADEGKAFNCSYFEEVLRSALQSVGFIARSIGLKGAKSDGNGAEHAVLEVWSNKHRKWILLDPTLDIYFEKKGVPLNAYEIRQEWFYNDGKDLTIVIGPELKKATKADMPIKRATHAGFGTLAIKPESIGKFLYIAYCPVKDGNTDYGNMFIIKDDLCKGVKYHDRKCPAKPETEAYWPMHQVALSLVSGDGLGIKVAMDTFTPDFKKYKYRIDGAVWKDGVPDKWMLHTGVNSLEAVAVNKFDREGAPSKVVLEVK